MLQDLNKFGTTILAGTPHNGIEVRLDLSGNELFAVRVPSSVTTGDQLAADRMFASPDRREAMALRNAVHRFEDASGEILTLLYEEDRGKVEKVIGGNFVFGFHSRRGLV